MGEACKVLEMKDYVPVPKGTVIHGKVTVGNTKKEVMYIVPTEPDDAPLLSAIEHLTAYQAELNADDDEIGENGVDVVKIDIPDRPQSLRVLSGNYWRSVNEQRGESVEDNRTLFSRILDRLGLG